MSIVSEAGAVGLLPHAESTAIANVPSRILSNFIIVPCLFLIFLVWMAVA
ncbi:MAG: hypothetical protein V2I24_04095 [Halieaceae bacterium]|nr:hypothetical protein [Halieaceae bacterium]